MLAALTPAVSPALAALANFTRAYIGRRLRAVIKGVPPPAPRPAAIGRRNTPCVVAAALGRCKPYLSVSLYLAVFLCLFLPFFNTLIISVLARATFNGRPESGSTVMCKRVKKCQKKPV